jgi:hypothetical protein
MVFIFSALKNSLHRTMSTETQSPAANTQPTCLVKDIQFFANSVYYKHKASINKYRTRFEAGDQVPVLGH